MRKLKTALSLTLCAGLFFSSVTGVLAQVKNDPLLDTKNANYQYQFDAVNVMKAWKLLKEKGYTKTKIGVMDTGVDSLHEDLKKNLKEYVRISEGIVKKGVADPDEHGTHVSGIMAATYGNGKGGSGIANGPDNDMAELYVAGVQDDDGNINDVDMIRAIEYFKEKGVKVVNMSLGGYSYDDHIHKAMKAAYDAGITLIAASGNDDTDKDSSPSSFKEVLSVNSSDSDNQTSYFSNYGFTSDISAPGSTIPSTVPGDRYVAYSGTSMASPVVAGVASLVLSANKDLTPRQVYNIICGTANKSMLKGKVFDDRQYGYGVVDAYAAVKAAYDMKEHPSDNVESLFVKNKTLTVKKGYEAALETLVTPATSTAVVTWSSSDKSIATVNEDGYVKGISIGNATITAKASDKEVKISVNVAEDVLPDKIEILKAKKVISVGEMDVTFVNVTPDGALIKEYYATSSNPEVAVAYSNYGVKGIKPGKATITLKTINGIEAKYEVVVKPAVSAVKFTKKTDKVKVGSKFKFEAAALNASGKQDVAVKGVEWSVTDTRLAVIDKKTGELTAKKAGNVFIKVTSKGLAEDGKKKISKILKVELTGKSKAKAGKETEKKNGNKVSAKHIENNEAMLKSKANDLIDNLYTALDVNRTRYTDEVLKAAFNLKKEARDYIAKSKFDTELYKEGIDPDTQMPGLVPTGKLADYNMRFKALASYDILKTGYKYNFDSLKNDVYKTVNDGYKGIDLKGFNEYYSQIVKAGYAKTLSDIKKSENVLELSKADATSLELPQGRDMELRGLRGITDYDAVFTNNDIKVIKRILKRQLDSYVNGELKMSGYKKDIKGLKKDLKIYKKDIDKTLYVGEMFDKTDAYIKKMVKKTGIAYEKISGGDMKRTFAALDKTLSSFNIKKYSSKGWEKVKEAYNDMVDVVSSSWYKGEVYKLADKFAKKLDKVKTDKEEKAEKAKKKAKKLKESSGKISEKADKDSKK
ncbi:MAG: hypothetical protein D8H95_32850 [Lachnospiraceae bacterium]|nr:MAG: hypothetical protein D8H95_32850 [Lachnospiraceae bacterium]